MDSIDQKTNSLHIESFFDGCAQQYAVSGVVQIMGLEAKFPQTLASSRKLPDMGGSDLCSREVLVNNHTLHLTCVTWMSTLVIVDQVVLEISLFIWSPLTLAPNVHPSSMCDDDLPYQDTGDFTLSFGRIGDFVEDHHQL